MVLSEQAPQGPRQEHKSDAVLAAVQQTSWPTIWTLNGMLKDAFNILEQFFGYYLCYLMPPKTPLKDDLTEGLPTGSPLLNRTSQGYRQGSGGR